ncbi:hypothetical protein AC579_1949 [Pseudocercospora musae]|uniref:Zn(2)-C6 fungal-type domain-containing protein n=1 Tax=Pseudocercospora musae TaxID=113226 RepID=A0A139I8F0_9PEZI|nr:hypothetical protein AC579_1949 [Pseudocercospora musae]
MFIPDTWNKEATLHGTAHQWHPAGNSRGDDIPSFRLVRLVLMRCLLTMSPRISSLDPSEPRASKDCRLCNRRRIKCDRSLPTCKKCDLRSLDCPGYGLRIRRDQGVASRGKLSGKALPIEDSPAVKPGAPIRAHTESSHPSQTAPWTNVRNNTVGANMGSFTCSNSVLFVFVTSFAQSISANGHQQSLVTLNPR